MGIQVENSPGFSAGGGQMSSEEKKKFIFARGHQKTVPGDVICSASRGVKCDHKVNLRHHDLEIPLVVCAISANPELCRFSGKGVK